MLYSYQHIVDTHLGKLLSQPARTSVSFATSFAVARPRGPPLAAVHLCRNRGSGHDARSRALHALPRQFRQTVRSARAYTLFAAPRFRHQLASRASSLVPAAAQLRDAGDWKGAAMAPTARRARVQAVRARHCRGSAVVRTMDSDGRAAADARNRRLRVGRTSHMQGDELLSAARAAYRNGGKRVDRMRPRILWSLFK
eukprot:4803273-Pleurochrysis_carterae.AAC.1